MSCVECECPQQFCVQSTGPAVLRPACWQVSGCMYRCMGSRYPDGHLEPLSYVTEFGEPATASAFTFGEGLPYWDSWDGVRREVRSCGDWPAIFGPGDIETQCIEEGGPCCRVDGCCVGVTAPEDGGPIVGVCCMPSSSSPNGCSARYTFQSCCATVGGRWMGTSPTAATECFNSRDCSLRQCCGCDWCCNNFDASTCSAFREYPTDNLPSTTDSSPLRRPNCRVVAFRPTKDARPPETFTRRVGPHEVMGVSPIRSVDRGPGAIQCRTSTAQLVRDDFAGSSGRRRVGELCNLYLRRSSLVTGYNPKVRQRCKVVKQVGGRHSFDCGFRPACPERPVNCI